MKFTSLVGAILGFDVMLLSAAVTLNDAAFLFAFIVPLATDAKRFNFKIETVTTTGLTNISSVATLGQ